MTRIRTQLKRAACWLIAAVLALAAAGCGDNSNDVITSKSPKKDAPKKSTDSDNDADSRDPVFRLEKIASIPDAVDIASPPHDRRIFIVQRTGLIVAFDPQTSKQTIMLDIHAKVGSASSEQGMLSIAFAEDFSDSGHMFVHYTNTDGDTEVSSFTAALDDGVAQSIDPRSEHSILQVDQPYDNHNGGQIAIGPDGALYVGLGDGGDAGDPQNHAQTKNDMLGKLIRIPLKDDGTADENTAEIWALGLRNPWRFSIDEESGLIYIGDVGQDKWEEIDAVPFDELQGANFGWNLYEGKHRYTSGDEDPSKVYGGKPLHYVPPIFEYKHPGGCSITGGVVYRGADVANLEGYYLFADFCSDWIRGFKYDGKKVSKRFRTKGVAQLSTFGVDNHGSVYAASLAGGIYMITE